MLEMVGSGDVAWYFSVPGRPLLWTRYVAGLGSIALSLGDGHIQTKILSQKAVKPHNNQQAHSLS